MTILFNVSIQCARIVFTSARFCAKLAVQLKTSGGFHYEIFQKNGSEIH